MRDDKSVSQRFYLSLFVAFVNLSYLIKERTAFGQHKNQYFYKHFSLNRSTLDLLCDLRMITTSSFPFLRTDEYVSFTTVLFVSTSLEMESSKMYETKMCCFEEQHSRTVLDMVSYC